MQISKSFFILIFLLAFNQSAGVGFFLEPFALILRKQGVALESLGFLYFLGIFMSVRFLWAGFVDKLNFGLFGHFKGWIFFTQIFIMLSLLGASFCDVRTDFWMILAYATLFSLMAATQYIAIDGLIYKTTTKKGRSKANSIKFAGTGLGYVLGAGFGLILYAKIGWQNTLIFLNLVPFLSLFVLFFTDESSLENTQKNLSLRDFFRYFKENKKWIYFIAIYPVMMSSFFALCSKILLDSGWSFEKIGWIVNTFGFIFGALVAFFAPIVINKIGNKNTLMLGLFMQIIGLLMLFFVLFGLNSSLYVLVMVCMIFLSYPLYAVVLTTKMMNNIKSKTPAFEYALQHSVFMLFGVMYNALSLILAGLLGYKLAIFFAILLGMVAIFLTSRSNFH